MVLVAVVSVPWMLLIRPFVLKSRYKKRQLAKGNTHKHRPMGGDDESPIINDTDAPVVDGEDDDEEVFDFGEVW